MTRPKRRARRLCDGLPDDLEPCSELALPPGNLCRAHAIELRRRFNGYRTPYSHPLYRRVQRRGPGELPRPCPLCGEPMLPGQPLDLDHIIPIRAGGTHTEQNLRWTHAGCNRARGAAQR